MNPRDCPHGRQIGKCADCDVARLEAENEALKSELTEQARVNGMGSEREARLLALNAELVEALRDAHNALEIFCTDESTPGQMAIAAVIQACAALVNVGTTNDPH